jgi:hypothetical protein
VVPGTVVALQEEMAEAIEVGMKVIKQICIGLQQFSEKTLEVSGLL